MYIDNIYILYKSRLKEGGGEGREEGTSIKKKKKQTAKKEKMYIIFVFFFFFFLIISHFFFFHARWSSDIKTYSSFSKWSLVTTGIEAVVASV